MIYDIHTYMLILRYQMDDGHIMYISLYTSTTIITNGHRNEQTKSIA